MAEVAVTQGLTGRIAVVTGAARGIGRAGAVALAAAGADVIGIDVAAHRAILTAREEARGRVSAWRGRSASS